MAKHNPNILERIFESFLWKSRVVILIPVLFSLLASVAMFIAGSIEIYTTILHLISENLAELNYTKLMIGVIGSVDLYLIGMVLLIFSFGIYEIFVSKIDIAHDGNEHNLLEITSLDELKTKLLKVIIMVLIVSFFKTILSATFQTPIEMLYFGASILIVTSCTFFLHKIE